MNVRLAVHLCVSIALALVLVFTGLAVGGPLLGLAGFVVWYLLEALVKALLPTSFQPGVEGAQATSAVYRGWAAKLVAATGLAGARTPEADAARVASGIRLCMPAFGTRGGSQTLGYLLLQRTPDGGTAVAWRGRGKGQQIQPLADGTAAFPQGLVQQNATQARIGYSHPVELDGGTYWLFGHNAALLKLLVGHQGEPAAPVAP
ncbi:hypothetical protein KNE206_48160 [Kitasatospora sp. NE20-6]|uniref:hypothetical protein n=1 Tax=Kitasatospora sp. NE20-6 TaxID=2859066 RepID=UPI0034DC7F1D